MTGNATGYVKGYIVGYVTGQELAKGCHFEAAGAAAAKAYSNVIIADDVNCTDPAKVLPIQLVSKTDIRAQVNLGDNPGNYKKELSITGSLEKYFGVMGVKAPTAYTLSGEGGGDTPVTPPAPTEAVKVANIAAFLANPNTNDTYEFTSPVNVVYQCNYKSGSGNMTYNLYVQDATGGLLIFPQDSQVNTKTTTVVLSLLTSPVLPLLRARQMLLQLNMQLKIYLQTMATSMFLLRE